MALCRITGVVYTPDGGVAGSRFVTFVRDVGERVESGYMGAISPDPVRTRTNADGSIDVSLITGYYYGFVESHGRKREYKFRVGVPDASTAEFSDILDITSGAVEVPAWLQQAFDARDDAEAAVVQTGADVSAAQEAAAAADESAMIAASRKDIVLETAFGSSGVTLDTISYSTTGVYDGVTVRAGDNNALYKVTDESSTYWHYKGSSGLKVLVTETPEGQVLSHWGGKYAPKGSTSGVFDNSEILQKMVDDPDTFDIIIDANGGEWVGVSYTSIIHNKSGFTAKFLNRRASFRPLSSMSLDASRISALGLANASEYGGKQCIFMITEYDGENGRALYAARDHWFTSMSVDSRGTPWERQISLASSPHSAWSKFDDCRVYASAYVFNPWEFIGTAGVPSTWRSRTYDMFMTRCRALDNSLNVISNWRNANSSSQWSGAQILLDKCYNEGAQQGYKVYNLPYSELRGVRGDQANKGQFCLDVYGSVLQAAGFSYESEFNRGSTTKGAGGFRIVNSNVVLSGGAFMVGYNPGASAVAPPSSGYPISDYGLSGGNTSLYIIQNSTVTIDQVYLLGGKDAENLVWPVVVRNGSVVTVNVGHWGDKYTDPANWNVLDTSIVYLKRIDGITTVIRGPSVVAPVEIQGAIASGANTASGLGAVAFNANDFRKSGPIRIALTTGTASGSNLPSSATLNGVLDVIEAGNFVSQRYTWITTSSTSADSFRMYNVNTSTWTPWT